MPNNNSVTSNPADGASCYNSDGTVFTYPVTLSPTASSAPPRVGRTAPEHHFEDALTNPATNLVRYACRVDGRATLPPAQHARRGVVYQRRLRCRCTEQERREPVLVPRRDERQLDRHRLRLGRSHLHDQLRDLAADDYTTESCGSQDVLGGRRSASPPSTEQRAVRTTVDRQGATRLTCRDVRRSRLPPRLRGVPPGQRVARGGVQLTEQLGEPELLVRQPHLGRRGASARASRTAHRADPGPQARACFPDRSAAGRRGTRRRCWTRSRRAAPAPRRPALSQ